MEEKIQISDILVEDRYRVEMGDIRLLADSIREFGLIQPIVLGDDLTGPNGPRPKLIAGGRRLAALKSLGLKELEHAKHWVHRDENTSTDQGKYRFRAMELEENVKRKEMTWPELVRAKKELLDLMIKLHGPAKVGNPTRAERAGFVTPGFGERKLAAMLGESVSTTHKDLVIATAIEALPRLANAVTKESAYRQATILVTIHGMQQAAKAAPQQVKDWELYEGRFQDNISKIANESVDLIYCDLPFGVDLDKMSKHDSGSVSYKDTRSGILADLPDVAVESFRILKDNRYAVFFFGFNYYPELLIVLRAAGFTVNLVPTIWLKKTNSSENPNTRYGNSYDPALVVMKGSPVFIRPGHQNYVELPPVSAGTKLQIAQQPVALVEHFILDMTAEMSTVVDLFAGSGTTGEAALKNKRRVVLFERDQMACHVIKSRLGALK